MAEFDSARTYAIRKLQYALVNSMGQPISLHPSADDALGSFVRARGDIILNEESRQRNFRALLKAKYKICPAFAWCRVDQEHSILTLPKEKAIDERRVKKAKPSRAGPARKTDLPLPRGRKVAPPRKSK